MRGMTHPTTVRRFGVALAALALATTACTSSGGEAETQGNTAAPEDTDPAELVITPDDGTEQLAPNSPIQVSAENGVITDVQVDQVVPSEAAALGRGRGRRGG